MSGEIPEPVRDTAAAVPILGEVAIVGDEAPLTVESVMDDYFAAEREEQDLRELAPSLRTSIPVRRRVVMPTKPPREVPPREPIDENEGMYGALERSRAKDPSKSKSQSRFL